MQRYVMEWDRVASGGFGDGCLVASNAVSMIPLSGLHLDLGMDISPNTWM